MSTTFISFPPIPEAIQGPQKPTRMKHPTMDLLAKLEILAVTVNNEDNSIILETASNNQYYKHTTHALTILHPRDKNSTFLVKLEGPLSTPSQVQVLSQSPTIPVLKKGVGEASTANFCFISGAMKLNIVSALAESTFSATFVRINLSPKDLSAHSIAPTLGSDFDPTLPQNRATDADEVFLPKQGEYPVWYFFYGDLAVPEIITERLGLDEMPVYRKAVVKGGILRTWGRGKFKALVDGDASARVEGWAYEVGSTEDEEILRYYETDYYEVVRCEICMVDVGEVVKGLVFRFVGDVD